MANIIEKINLMTADKESLFEKQSYKCPKCGNTFSKKREGKAHCFKCGVKCDKVDESSPYTSTENNSNWWGRTTQIYFNRQNEVLWSHTPEFPKGYTMTEEDFREAKRRGYVLIPRNQSRPRGFYR